MNAGTLDERLKTIIGDDILRKVTLFSLLITAIFLIGCNQTAKVQGRTASAISINTSDHTPEPKESSTANSNQSIKEEINSFISAVSNGDKFKKLISDEGIDVVRYFVSGNGARGKDALLHFEGNQIPSDLQFLIKDEIPFDVSTVFGDMSTIDTSDMTITTVNKTGLLSKPIESINTFWNACNDLRTTMDDQTDDKYQVIKFTDSFVLTESETDFGTGVWVIFNKDSDDKYYLRLIADFR